MTTIKCKKEIAGIYIVKGWKAVDISEDRLNDTPIDIEIMQSEDKDGWFIYPWGGRWASKGECVSLVESIIDDCKDQTYGDYKVIQK